MSRQANGCVEHRGPVLIASDNRLFREIVGGMVADAGFVAEFLERTESAASSIARTRPDLVICDCGGSETGIRRLVAELSARHLPLLMAWSRGQEEYTDDLSLPERVEWITFPITQDVFRVTIDRLMLLTPAHRLTLSGPGVAVDAAIQTRTLEETLNDEVRDKAAGRRSIRLLP